MEVEVEVYVVNAREFSRYKVLDLALTGQGTFSCFVDERIFKAGQSLMGALATAKFNVSVWSGKLSLRLVDIH